jgi:methylmalonyl-CoA mutase cobalamin-binding domain/chain
MSITPIYESFLNALLQINRTEAARIFEGSYAEGSSIHILESLLVTVLEQVGQGWQAGEYSLAQVYMCGIICEELMETYLPNSVISETSTPKIAIAVLQDHHSLGKRIVCSVLRVGGYEVADFGVGLSVDELVEKTVESKVEILLISTLMLHSALKVKLVKEMLAKSGMKTKIVVGGAPFRLDETLWESVHADAYGEKASDVITILEQLVREVG